MTVNMTDSTFENIFIDSKIFKSAYLLELDDSSFYGARNTFNNITTSNLYYANQTYPLLINNDSYNDI